MSLKKVLIVDDSMAETRLIQSVLEQAGYWPVALNDPTRLEQTLEMEHPGLILLDVVMPQRNGFQACRDLEAPRGVQPYPHHFRHLEEHNQRQFWAERQGGDGFVGKPFTAQELITEVRKFF